MNIPANLHPLAVLKPTADEMGTSLQGYCFTTYAALRVLLGEPILEDGDKVTCRWCFKLACGERFTVYDWKEASTPAGRYRWHIGGTSEKALKAFNRHTGLPCSADPF